MPSLLRTFLIDLFERPLCITAYIAVFNAIFLIHTLIAMHIFIRIIINYVLYCCKCFETLKVFRLPTTYYFKINVV